MSAQPEGGHRGHARWTAQVAMYGLMDVDVTTANRLLASHDPPWSLTAYLSARPSPTPLATPWPSGPVVASTPFVRCTSGWPGVRLPH